MPANESKISTNAIERNFKLNIFFNSFNVLKKRKSKRKIIKKIYEVK